MHDKDIFISYLREKQQEAMRKAQKLIRDIEGGYLPIGEK